jgi:hypothetical protein
MEQTELVSVEAAGFYSGETRISFERIEPRTGQRTLAGIPDALADVPDALAGSYWLKITSTGTGTIGDVAGRQHLQMLIPPAAMTEIVKGLMEDRLLRQTAHSAMQEINFREGQAGRR